MGQRMGCGHGVTLLEMLYFGSVEICTIGSTAVASLDVLCMFEKITAFLLSCGLEQRQREREREVPMGIPKLDSFMLPCTDSRVSGQAPYYMDEFSTPVCTSGLISYFCPCRSSTEETFPSTSQSTASSSLERGVHSHTLLYCTAVPELAVSPHPPGAY